MMHTHRPPRLAAALLTVAVAILIPGCLQVVRQDAPYYKKGAQQVEPPDGSFKRGDHVWVFGEKDSRRKYPMFKGEEWGKNQDLVDRLRAIAPDAGHTVAELVINWTINQPGITCALCGAKRPEQIQETAGGSGWKLTDEQLAAVDQALADRGTPTVDVPV